MILSAEEGLKEAMVADTEARAAMAAATEAVAMAAKEAAMAVLLREAMARGKEASVEATEVELLLGQAQALMREPFSSATLASMPKRRKSGTSSAERE